MKKKLTLLLCSIICISCGDEKKAPEPHKRELTRAEHDALEKLRIATNKNFEAEIQKEIAAGRADSIQVRRLKLNIMLINGEITFEQLEKAEQAFEAESQNQPENPHGIMR